MNDPRHNLTWNNPNAPRDPSRLVLSLRAVNRELCDLFSTYYLRGVGRIAHILQAQYYRTTAPYKLCSVHLSSLATSEPPFVADATAQAAARTIQRAYRRYDYSMLLQERLWDLQVARTATLEQLADALRVRLQHLTDERDELRASLGR